MYIKTHRTCPVIERSKEDTFAVFCGVLQNSRILGVVCQCMCMFVAHGMYGKHKGLQGDRKPWGKHCRKFPDQSIEQFSRSILD